MMNIKIMEVESLLSAGTWVGMLGLSNLKPFLTANASNNWESRGRKTWNFYMKLQVLHCQGRTLLQVPVIS